MTLENELEKKASQWANEIVTRATANLGNKADLIEVKSTVRGVSGGNVSIEVEAINRKTNRWGEVNVAHAYEYGSGIHGRAHTKYPITPRGGKGFLVFYWQKLDQYVALPHVNHPGVKALKNGRGYMKPAIDTVRRKINKELRKTVGDGARSQISRSFNNRK
jgi:hypothetical protein